KPDGLFVITPKQGPAFVEALPVRKFHGVGPATADKMARLGIETGADLRAQSLAFLEEKFGKAGPYYYWIARGIDERPVRADRERKSVGAEDTFASDLFDLESARKELAPLVGKVWRYCEERSIQGRTVTLKVKFADFQQITRSRTIGGVIEGEADLATVSGTLLDQVFPVSKGIRLLGVTLSNLNGTRTEADRQMSLTI
ncbi:MAG: DNA polymerase IV, partial [Mesorhizobium sp.]